MQQQQQPQPQPQPEPWTPTKPRRGCSASWNSGRCSESHSMSAPGKLDDTSDMLRRVAQLEEQVRRRSKEVGELRVVISTKDDIIRSLGAKLQVAESATLIVRAKDEIIRKLGLELSTTKVASARHLGAEILLPAPPTIQMSTGFTQKVSGGSPPKLDETWTIEQPSAARVGKACGCDENGHLANSLNSVSTCTGGASSTAEVAVQTDLVDGPSSESLSQSGSWCGSYCSVEHSFASTEQRACRATLPIAFDDGLFTVLPVSPDAKYFPGACSIVDQRIAAFLESTNVWAE